MASTHKHIRSSTANKRPTTAIADGQVALNTNAASPGLFFKDSTGASIIKIGPVHVGSTAPNATPGAGGSAGNSTGEVWLDNSLSPVGVKIWDGSAWVNATPAGSTTVQGLLELATNAETQAGSDTARAVTSAGLQSKVSDSTSTTSSTTIASSTAVKAAYDLAAAALPLSGGTITGNLEIGTTGSLSFEGSTADAFETTIAVTNPTADRTITLPDTTGTVVTTGDTGTVTSTMILDGTIVNGDINASAAIAHSKLANITAGQVLLGNASNVPTATALSGDVTVNSSGVTAISSGVIVNADVNASAAIAGTKISPDFGSQTITTTGVVSAALGAAATPSITFTGDLNTGIYSPGADQVAVATNGTGRLFVDSSGRVLVGTSTSTNNVRVQENFGLVTTGSGNIGGMAITNYGGTGASARPLLDFQRSRGTTDGSFTVVASGDQLGSIIFRGADGSQFVDAAFINCEVDGTPGANDMPGRIVLSTTADGGSSPTERMRIDSSGRVGIGTTSPSERLEISGNFKQSNGTQGLQIINTTVPYIQAFTSGGNNPLQINGQDLRFFTGSSFGAETERARIDSSGRLLVGTSSSSNVNIATFQGNSTVSTGTGIINIALGNTSPGANDDLGRLQFTDSGHNSAVQIAGQRDGGTWNTSTSRPSRLVFSTTADGASSPTERMRITSGGYLKVSDSGSYFGSTASYHEFTNTANVPALILRTTNGSQTDTTLSVSPARAASSAYKMIMCYSGNEADLEFNLRGDGNAYADGSWNGGGADYAEYFEWSDGNPGEEDRRGISVVLDGDKIREAVAGEDPIGVISGNPSVVGDAAWNKWNGKHLRDEFGSYLLDDNGERQLNPAYDPDVEYISREQRPEWDCVGLMGKLRIRKGQATGSRWIKMRDISATVEEWLVR